MSAHRDSFVAAKLTQAVVSEDTPPHFLPGLLKSLSAQPWLHEQHFGPAACNTANLPNLPGQIARYTTDLYT